MNAPTGLDTTVDLNVIGTTPTRKDGIDKVWAGLTTIEVYPFSRPRTA
jgi:hypothetical protein